MKFPVAYDRAPSESEPLPWEAIKSCLVSLGAREERWPDSLLLDLAPDHSLQFHATRDKEHPEQYAWIEIRCQAPWNHVLDLYRHLREIDPDLVLFDPQKGFFHDPETFEPLTIAQRKYQEG